MPDLETLLDDLGALPALRALALQVASERPVYAERQSGYVSLRPASGGPIAAFINRSYVDIAHAPALAPLKAADLPGAQLIEDTPATTFVRLSDEAAQAPAPVLVVKEALAWRASMPDTRSEAATSAYLAVAQCPRCHLHHAGECV